MQAPRRIATLARSIAADTPARRRWMGWLIAAALGLIALGAFPLEPWLARGWIRFTCFWGACAWLTITAALLALYDSLATLRDARNERRSMVDELNRPNPSDPDPHSPAPPRRNP